VTLNILDLSDISTQTAVLCYYTRSGGLSFHKL